MSAGGKICEHLMAEEKLEPPTSFLFPFTPYGIQHDFMTKLYFALENGKLGIFESPTGTVSSVSVYVKLYLESFRFVQFPA